MQVAFHPQAAPKPRRAFALPWAMRKICASLRPKAGTTFERRGSMHRLQRILVPVDFSAGSRFAVEYAAFLAAQFGAAIDVLHVMEPPIYVAPEATLYIVESSAKQTLAEFARS